MTTDHEQNNLESHHTDPQLDALLDRAVSVGSPPAPPASPDLTQRILDQTIPMLGQTPVLAKIGPVLLRVAAAFAVIVGAGVAAYVLTDDPVVAVDSNAAIARIEPGLKAIEGAIEPGNTRIDEQLDAVSLRVELARSDSVWGSVDTDTNSLMDQAATGYELDQFSDDSAFLWTDDSALF